MESRNSLQMLSGKVWTFWCCDKFSQPEGIQTIIGFSPFWFSFHRSFSSPSPSKLESGFRSVKRAIISNCQSYGIISASESPSLPTACCHGNHCSVVLQELSHCWPIIWICNFPTPGKCCSLSPPGLGHSNSLLWPWSHSCFLLCYSAIPKRRLQRRTDNISKMQRTEVLWTLTEIMRHHAYWQWGRNIYILLRGKSNELYHAFGNSRPHLYSFLFLSSPIECIVNLLDSYIKKIIKLDSQVLQEMILVNLF